MSLYPVCAGHRIGFIYGQQQQYYVGEPVAPRFNKGRQNGLGVKKCNEMRDTCRVRSARVIRAKFLAMHFPRTCRPTDVDVALSPLLGRCSALVYYYYHYYYCYYRDGVALSRSLSLFNLYTSCGG